MKKTNDVSVLSKFTILKFSLLLPELLSLLIDYLLCFWYQIFISVLDCSIINIMIALPTIVLLVALRGENIYFTFLYRFKSEYFCCRNCWESDINTYRAIKKKAHEPLQKLSID